MQEAAAAIQVEDFSLYYQTVKDVPVGVRGLLATVSVHLGSGEDSMKHLQRVLGCKETGVFDEDTSETLKSMLQYKRMQELMNEVILDIERTQVNGAVFAAKQFFMEVK